MAEPALELRLLRATNDARLARWKPVDPAFEIAHTQDGDMVRRADGAAFASAAFDVDATYTPLPKDYAPFSPFGDRVHCAAAVGVSGSGGTLPHLERIQQSFGPGHDVSQIKAHVGGAAAEASEAIGASAYVGTQPADDNSEANVAQAKHAAPTTSTTTTDAVVQRAGPAIPIAIWLGKAVAATTIDAFIDAAIATILALPTPGALDNVVNFLVNLVPGLGEAKKVKKAGKLIKIVDDIVDVVKDMKRLNIPGAAALAKNLSRESGKLKNALTNAKLDDAKAIFQRMLGYLREAQIASKVRGKGDDLLALGMQKVGTKKLLTDIDVVFKQGDEVIFGQVKAGKAANFGRDSGRGAEFENQARRTVEAARDYGDEYQSITRVKYFVDDISDEAREFLQGLNIEVVNNQSFLH
ncbi:MAG: hypothetical protein MJE77_44425 [Proteobacteria bacterium]|nr:hypothetical protein [Pseudomonadota bacterium]